MVKIGFAQKKTKGTKRGLGGFRAGLVVPRVLGDQHVEKVPLLLAAKGVLQGFPSPALQSQSALGGEPGAAVAPLASDVVVAGGPRVHFPGSAVERVYLPYDGGGEC